MLDNISAALGSIWSNKLRSLLTLLGIVIGVASVTTLVALGQGLKKDVGTLIQGFGTNVVVAVAGKIDTSGSGGLGGGNPADVIKTDILTVKDIEAVEKLPDVEAVTPISLVSGGIAADDKQAVSPVIAGVYPNFLQAMQLVSMGSGRMFTADESGVVVLSPKSGSQLFGEVDPVGKRVDIGGMPFDVIGVLGKSTSSSLFGSEFETISLVPFADATRLNKDVTSISRIVAKAEADADVAAVKNQMHDAILSSHAGQENFSVLTQDDLLGLFNQFLNLATAMVSAIAAISLIVGGIGIMNIMLVTVTERTREIGLRKALGASRGAILFQFLTEAIVITLVGGLIGLGIALATGLAIASKTPLKPEFSWQVVALTVGISVVIGVIFGLWPALRAAKKDPIEALRYE